MMPDFIIDGYNVMHAAGLARRQYGPGDLERARGRLLLRIRQGMNIDQAARTLVVFDACDVTDPLREAGNVRGLCVIFSPTGQEADDVIEELVAQHSAPRQLVVVSSDHRLQRAARSRRAGYLDSDSFLDRLDRYRQAAAQRGRAVEVAEGKTEEGSVAAEEFDHWLSEFGEIAVDEIENEVRRESRPGADRSSSSTRAAAASEQNSGKRSLPQQRAQAPGSSPSQSRRSKAKPAEDSADEQEGGSSSPTQSMGGQEVESGELQFWEQRVADVLRDAGELPDRIDPLR